MSKLVTCVTALAMALLTGCADAGEVSEEESETLAEEQAAEGDAAEETNPDDVQKAVTVPSFALLSQRNGKAMTGGALEVGSLVTQMTLLGGKGGANQRWVSINQNITPESRPNLCLEASSGFSGAQLRLQPCNGGPLQGWRLEIKLQNGVRLTRWKNLPSGLYLDDGGTNSEGAAMTVRAFSNSSSQLFRRLF